jgi:phage shock protein C
MKANAMADHQHHRCRKRSRRRDHRGSPNPHRLYRNPDRMIGGVCSGIATYFGWPRAWVRLATLGSLFMFPPPTIFGYLLAWWFLDERPTATLYDTPEEERFWRNVSTRPKVTMSELRHRYRDLEGRLIAMEQVVTSEEFELNQAFRDLDEKR